MKLIILTSILCIFGLQDVSANCGDRVFVSGKPNKLKAAVLKKMESAGYKIVTDYRDSDYSISVYRNNNPDWGIFTGSPAAIITRPQRGNASQQLVSDRRDGFDKASLLKFSRKVEAWVRSDKYCD